MTPNEITEIIAQQLGSSGDFSFKRTLLARVNASRAQFMKRTLEKHPADRMYFIQKVAIPMKLADTLDIDGATCKQSVPDCTAIPRPLRSNGILFDYVGSVDGSNAFTYAPFGASNYLGADPYSKGQKFYSWENDSLTTSPVDRIAVRGIFADPEEAYNLDAKTRSCTNCDFWESRYPCTEDVLDLIIKDVVAEWKTKPVNKEVNATQNEPDPTA
jgi:hypothetical protein